MYLTFSGTNVRLIYPLETLGTSGFETFLRAIEMKPWREGLNGLDGFWLIDFKILES